MNVYYEGKNISKSVDVRKCIHTDVSGGRRDMLDIEFEYSDRWFGWQPQRDDRIQIELNGYTTGDMYVNTVLPEHGRYRIIATGAKSAARRKTWASYEDKNLNAIMATCAAECGMQYGLYGIGGGNNYSYIMRENEDSMAFLDRLLMMEGGRLKCLNGKLRGIGIEYAQNQSAMQTIKLVSTQMQARYIRRADIKFSGLTVQTPYAKASAYDTAGTGGIHPVITMLPAMDNTQAGRWARGLPLTNNRTAEKLEINMEYNAGLTALARIDVESSTDAADQWIVDEVEHDFVLLKSRATLLRCITSIR